MAGDNIDDDEYVARLLKQDAVDASKKYNFVGLDAFHPKRCVGCLSRESSSTVTWLHCDVRYD